MTNSEQQSAGNPADPFTTFWSDFMSKMAPPSGMAPLPGMPAVPPMAGGADFSKQMRQSLFDSMSSYCDDFMRSEQFLTAMRQSMDGALAFRQQLDKFLTSTVRSGQQPAREDTDHILIALRSMEDRVLKRLERLEDRLGELEDGANDRSGESSRTAPAVANSDSAGRKKTAKKRPRG